MTLPPVPWSVDIPILGVRTRFRGDDPSLLEMVREHFAEWRAFPVPAGAPQATLSLVRDGAVSRADPTGGDVDITVAGERLTLRGDGVRAESDASAGEARCELAPGGVDADWLGAEVLDPLTLFLLTARDRTPLHAAGVLVGETAALLLGRSGAGKSSLALSAARAGLPILSDDTVFVQANGGLRIWGLPRPIHVLAQEHAALAEERSLRLRRGRWKAPVTHGEGRRPHSAGRGVLFFLEHGDRAAARAIGADEAVERTLATLEPGFDRFREVLPGLIRRLAEAGAWRLTLSKDPDEAIALARATLR